MNKQTGKKILSYEPSQFYYKAYSVYSNLTKEEIESVEGVSWAEKFYENNIGIEVRIHPQYDESIVLHNLENLAENKLTL